MLNILLAILIFVSLPLPLCRASFESGITILEKKDVAKLTDDQLMDAYLNTVVEIDASRAFHNTSGFSQKDYNEFRNILKYRLVLLMEIHSRNLDIPQFERY